jgi:hypothetical protein
MASEGEGKPDKCDLLELSEYLAYEEQPRLKVGLNFHLSLFFHTDTRNGNAFWVL